LAKGKGEKEMNLVVLIGRIAREPELRNAQNGMQICRFSIAVNRRQKEQEGQPTADFLNCTAFGKTANNIAIYFHKGSRIGVEGHIQTGSYTDRDGKKVYTTDIIVDQFDFIDTKAETQQIQQQAAAVNTAQPQQQAPTQPRQAQPNSGIVPPDGFMSIPDGIDEPLPFS
jgi:single-strand DNA-binding protein